jgi:hypothetical protein
LGEAGFVEFLVFVLSFSLGGFLLLAFVFSFGVFLDCVGWCWLLSSLCC